MFNPAFFYQAGVPPINTIINGIGGSITTKAVLASKLGISVNLIRRFHIIENDVHATIIGDYSPIYRSFSGYVNLVSYNDITGLIKTINYQVFDQSSIQSINIPSCESMNGAVMTNCELLTTVNCPALKIIGSAFNGCLALNSITTANVEEIGYRAFQGTKIPIMSFPKLRILNGSGVFYNCTATTQLLLPIIEEISTLSEVFRAMSSAVLISMRKLKVFGDPAVAVANCFGNLKTNCTIEVNIVLLTANAGSPNATILWAKTNRSAIVKFYDDDGNYISTL